MQWYVSDIINYIFIFYDIIHRQGMTRSTYFPAFNILGSKCEKHPIFKLSKYILFVNPNLYSVVMKLLLRISWCGPNTDVIFIVCLISRWINPLIYRASQPAPWYRSTWTSCVIIIMIIMRIMIIIIFNIIIIMIQKYLGLSPSQVNLSFFSIFQRGGSIWQTLWQMLYGDQRWGPDLVAEKRPFCGFAGAVVYFAGLAVYFAGGGLDRSLTINHSLANWPPKKTCCWWFVYDIYVPLIHICCLKGCLLRRWSNQDQVGSRSTVGKIFASCCAKGLYLFL